MKEKKEGDYRRNAYGCISLGSLKKYFKTIQQEELLLNG
jgi:hypothetical protein